MKLRPIIEDIARLAEDFITDRTDRAKARVEIVEFLTLEHPRLSASDHRNVAEQVLAILEADDFFPERFVDSFDADQNIDDQNDS
jgi:hypothetical protein